MAAANPQGKELKNTGYEIFIGVLSVLSIVNIVLLYAVDDPQLNKVIWVMNGLLSGIFLIDFTYRLFTAVRGPATSSGSSAGQTCSPACPFQQVKILRIFRLVRVYRLLREYGLKNITAVWSRTVLGARCTPCY